MPWCQLLRDTYRKWKVIHGGNYESLLSSFGIGEGGMIGETTPLRRKEKLLLICEEFWRIYGGEMELSFEIYRWELSRIGLILVIIGENFVHFVNWVSYS